MILILLLGKITLLLSAACGAAFLLRRETAELRHRVWACALAGSLALPLLMFTLPGWHSATVSRAIASVSLPAVTGPAIHTLPAMTIRARASAPWWQSTQSIVLAVWLAGFALMMLRLLHGLASLAWVRMRATPIFEEPWMWATLRRSRELGIERDVRLLAAKEPSAMPLTWGAFRPAILLPADATGWTDDRRDIVLAHELAHIARGDWPWQICGEVARALYWFHPLAWIAASRLREESERAADDAVLHTGVRPSDYASELLELARTLKNNGRVWSTALAMARSSHLERRFIAMLNPSIDRRRVSRTAALATTFASLALLLPLAALNSPAQQRTGRFTGTVYDPRSAAVPNATVILSNPKALTRDMTTANSAGKYTFTGIPAGVYEMSVLQPGFSTYTTTVALDEGRDFSQDVALILGPVNERIEVVAQGEPAAQFAANMQVRPARIRIGGNVQATKLIQKVPPVYPASAKQARIQGSVMLQALIGTDGRLSSLRVQNSQIDPDLARASVEAVSQWVYQPTLLNGEPVEVMTNIAVNFTLLP